MRRDDAQRVVIDSGFLDGEPASISDVNGYFTPVEFTRMFGLDTGDGKAGFLSYSSGDWEDIRIVARRLLR
tara:strand:- start:66 stop:278 length:213 start_codon:yes stop_codon:yes gene_type:complete